MMESIKKFVRSSGPASRVFLAIWLFLCALITVSFLEGSPKENIVSDIAALIGCYLLFSVMFLIPAGTLAQTRRAKAGKAETRYSEKSYWITLLLAAFLGTLGAHRFYTGKKATGILYLFTFGGGGIGWIVDVILAAAGMFPDREGHIIPFPGRGKQEFDLRPQPAETSEAPEASEAPQQAAEPPALFSEIEVPGAPEKRQEIPARPSAQDAFCEKPSVSAGLSETEAVNNEAPLYTARSYFRDPSAKFFSEMRLYADVVGQKAEFVPFTQYGPTYDSMDRRQRAWYFYWRAQVRKGEYPDTDLSYIFVHTYELLSGCGWTQALDGYRQLRSLWMSYRERFPKLDQYLVGWIFDFARQYQLDFTMPERCDLPLPGQAAARDLLLDRHSDEKPLRLPFPLICSLCDYPVTDSRFYQDGHQQLMQEAVPRVVALADAVLLKEKGLGIFAVYGPKRPRKQRYYMFQSAICPEANERVFLSVKAYNENEKLRNYVNQLVRYSENVLRSLYGYRGRLRGIELEPELSRLIESFLKKEYTPKKTEKAPPKQVEIKLDFDSIASLRAQSDAVRDALEVAEDEMQYENTPEPEPAAQQGPAAETETRGAQLDETGLTEELRQFWEALTDLQRQALRAVLCSGDPQEKLTELAEEAMSMPELLIDEINDAATQFLDDILIDTFDGAPAVLEQYADDLKRAAEQLGGE